MTNTELQLMKKMVIYCAPLDYKHASEVYITRLDSLDIADLDTRMIPSFHLIKCNVTDQAT
jgi:hypothetical protein